MSTSREHNALPIRKVTMVGDAGVGKSAIIEKRMKKTFSDVYANSVFESHEITSPVLPSGNKIRLTLDDASGNECYDRLRPLSYSGTDLLLVCFPVAGTNDYYYSAWNALQHEIAFSNIEYKWHPEVRHFCPKTPILLVGTKADLRDDAHDNGGSIISRKRIDQLRKDIGAIGYLEVSAKACTDQEMDEFFAAVAEAALTGRLRRQGETLGCRVM